MRGLVFRIIARRGWDLGRSTIGRCFTVSLLEVVCPARVSVGLIGQFAQRELIDLVFKDAQLLLEIEDAILLGFEFRDRFVELVEAFAS